jgi:hypothetical protein
MKALRRFKASPALVVAAIALAVALSETGWATLQQTLPRNSVGVKQIKTGAVRSPEVRNGSIGLGDLSPGARRGIRGPAGPAGPAGPTGQVAELWAIVNPSGSLSRSSGTTSTGRLGLGQYEVIFNQDVQNCIYQATVGDAGVISGALGMTSVGRRSGNANGVRVNTRNQNGAAADRGFHLIVVC